METQEMRYPTIAATHVMRAPSNLIPQSFPIPGRKWPKRFHIPFHLLSVDWYCRLRRDVLRSIRQCEKIFHRCRRGHLSVGISGDGCRKRETTRKLLQIKGASTISIRQQININATAVYWERQVNRDWVSLGRCCFPSCNMRPIGDWTENISRWCASDFIFETGRQARHMTGPIALSFEAEKKTK